MLALPLHRAARAAATAGATALLFLFAYCKKDYQTNDRAKNEQNGDRCNIIRNEFEKHFHSLLSHGDFLVNNNLEFQL